MMIFVRLILSMIFDNQPVETSYLLPSVRVTWRISDYSIPELHMEVYRPIFHKSPCADDLPIDEKCTVVDG